jgi:hypothetical protein
MLLGGRWGTGPAGSLVRRWCLPLVLAAVLGLSACSAPPPLTAPAIEEVARARVVAEEPAVLRPSGEVTVGVPAEPTAWIVPDADDVAAADLAALWGLPLYRVDASGRPVDALVVAEAWEPDGRSVTLELAEGTWSDGTPVGADDVVATVEALRGTGLGRDLDVVAEVVAEGSQRVRFELRQPTVRWPVLLGAVGVLPAHVLADGGLDTAATLEVTGGPFRLAEHEPGLGASFVAHAGSPLGAPGLEALHVRYVPSYDVALELLDDGRLDVALGYLPIGAEDRAGRLRLEAAAPVGGTWVALRWHPDATVTPAQRRGVANVLDVSEQVEGLALGEELSAPLLEAPRAERSVGERDRGAAGEVEDVAGLEATLVVRADEEALTLTGRLLEAQVRAREGRLDLRRERTPADVPVAREQDASLVVRRDLPRPDLARDLDEDDHALARSADAAPSAADPAVVAALDAVADQARVVSLYRPPVAHVWRGEVRGIEPSAWPGIGLSSAHRWHLDVDR